MSCRRCTPGHSPVLGLAVVLLAVQFAAAAELPLLPGIGAVDRRVAVNPGQPPWDAIAKVQTNIGARCTGALIAPTVVLTATHCLYNHRTRALLQAGSLHVLIGYDRAEYRWHRMVTHYRVGAGFDGTKGGLQISDWARLELDSAIPGVVAPLPIAQEPVPAGAAIALAGYNQDRAQILMTDLTCHVTGTMAAFGKAFITHDCDATRGTSGGPLLMQQGGRWIVVGINVGATAATNLAVPTTAFEN